MTTVFTGETEILGRDEDGITARIYVEDTFYGDVRLDVESTQADEWTTVAMVFFDDNGDHVTAGVGEQLALEACADFRRAVEAEVARLWGVA